MDITGSAKGGYKMKRLFTIFCIFIFALSMTAPAYGLTVPGGISGNPESNEPIVLTGVFDKPGDAYYPHIRQLIVLEEDEPLSDQLPDTMPFSLADGRSKNIPVAWNTTSSEYTLSFLHDVEGYAVSDENTSLAEGYDGKVTYPVFRKGGEPLEVFPLQSPSLSDPLLPVNSDPTSLNFITDRKWAAGTDGWLKSDKTWVWEWDFSAVDTAKTGAYPVTGRLAQTPDWITVAEENRVSSFTAYVLPEDSIEIFAATRVDAVLLEQDTYGGALIIQWLYNSEQVTEPVLQQMDTNGQWTNCDESWNTYKPAGKYTYAGLSLFLHNIPAETEHTLRLRYLDVIDGETVERFSDPIKLTVPKNIGELLRKSSDGIPEGLVIDGDRDGGDSNGTPLPEQVQPAPSRNKKKKKTEKAITEIVTDTYTAISGLRVDSLVKNDATVLFEKQGISAEIPSELLKNLKLKDTEMLEVALLRPSETSLLIAVYADHKLVENISGTTVFLPWDAKNGTSIRCVDLWGNFISNATYDEKSRTLCFTVPTPNTYFLQEQPSHHPSPYADKGGTV